MPFTPILQAAEAPGAAGAGIAATPLLGAARAGFP
jgi:hypothetical protein